MEKNNLFVKKLCFCAVMSALYVGLDFLSTALSAPFSMSFKISLNAFPVIVAAVCFGPVWGAATGFIGAFIGQLITYGITATTLLWTLPAVIRGLAVGLMFIAFKKSLKRLPLILNCVISALLVTACNTVVMYIDSKIFGYPAALFGIMLLSRILSGIATSAVIAVILPPIVRKIKAIAKV